MYTMVIVEIWCKASIFLSPSIADVTDIGGVIMPSASRAAPPTIAGKTVHLPCRFTNAYNENIPPSPLLSALRVNITYFTVVCIVSVHIIQERAPIINSSLMCFPLQTAFMTYRGDVPISPYIIPRAIVIPARDALCRFLAKTFLL